MGALGTHVAEGLVIVGIAKLIIVDNNYIEFLSKFTKDKHCLLKKML